MKGLGWLILIALLLGNLGVFAQEEVPVFTLKSEAFPQKGEIPLVIFRGTYLAGNSIAGFEVETLNL